MKTIAIKSPSTRTASTLLDLLLLGAQKLQDDDRLYTPDEACYYLNRCKSSLANDRKSGKLQAVKSGRKVLFRKSALDAFLKIEQTASTHE